VINEGRFVQEGDLSRDVCARFRERRAAESEPELCVKKKTKKTKKKEQKKKNPNLQKCPSKYFLIYENALLICPFRSFFSLLVFIYLII
jgi:hypothetical protein